MKHVAEHPDQLAAALKESVLSGPGETDPTLRVAALHGQAMPTELADYLAKVSDAANQVVDADIARLRHAGHSEDAIFELTAAAALGAGLVRLSAGLAAIRGEEERCD